MEVTRKAVIIVPVPVNFNYLINMYFNGIPNHDCIKTIVVKCLDRIAEMYQGDGNELSIFKDVIEFLFEWNNLELIEGRLPLFSIKEDQKLSAELYLFIQTLSKEILEVLISNNLVYSSFCVEDMNFTQIVLREV